MRSDGTPTTTITSIVNSAAPAVFTLTEQLATRSIQSKGAQSADQIVDSVNTVVGAEVYRAKKITVPNAKPPKNPSGKLETVEIEFTKGGSSKLAAFFADGSTSKVALDRGLYFVGIASFALSMKVLSDAGFENLTPSGALSIISGLLDVTGSSLGMVTNISKANLAVLGGISAALGFGCAVKDALASADRQDYVGMTGYSISALGSSLTFMSCLLFTAGAGSSSTVIGIPIGTALGIVGGVLAAAGAVIVALGAQSDLEVFVSHCAFGRLYGDKGGGVMSWSCGWPMRDFKAVPSLQAKSLLNLLTTFTVAYSNSFRDATIEISMGLVQEHSKFHIEVTNTYKDGWKPFTSEMTLTVGTKDVAQISGYALNAPRRKATVYWPSAQPKAFLDAKHDTRLYNGLLHTSCIVWLDFEGNGSAFYPTDSASRPKAEKEIQSSF